MRRTPGAAVVVPCLLGAALACLGGCATVAGLDSIQECVDCIEGGGSLQDGTVAGDAKADSSADASGDAALDTAASMDGPGPDSAQSQDAARQDATDAQAEGDASGDAAPVDAHGDVIEAGSPCNPSTCVGGCCQGINCVGGTQDNACGLTGGGCQDCTQLGDTCVSGACQAPSSNCPTTCSGCCTANGACHATSSPTYCPTAEGGTFKKGLPCEDCVSEGYAYCILDIVAYICSPIP